MRVAVRSHGGHVALHRRGPPSSTARSRKRHGAYRRARGQRQLSVGSLAEVRGRRIANATENGTAEGQEEEEDEEPSYEDFLMKRIEENPWHMSEFDRVWLQAGWLVQFVAAFIVVVTYACIRGRLWPADTPDEGKQAAGSAEESALYRAMFGHGAAAVAVNAVTIALSCVNFYTFSVMTEAKMIPGYSFLGVWDPFVANEIAEVAGLVILGTFFVLRLCVINKHPSWSRRGALAPLCYVAASVYPLLELIALIATVYELPSWLTSGNHSHLNFMWLFFARSLEMLERSGSGLGVKRLTQMFVDDGKLLVTVHVLGLVVWLVMSSLYFCANRENTEEGAVWEAALYSNGTDWQPWKKFESIPSSMWFVLINLVKEHPMAECHTTFFQRLWVCCVCIFAMPLFALPTSILQNSLFENQGEEEFAALQAGGSDEQADEELQSDPGSQKWYYIKMAATAVLVFASIKAYFFHTARGQEHSTVFFIPVYIDVFRMAEIDCVVGCVFAIEWVVYVLSGGAPYIFSCLGLIDLVAWLPSGVALGVECYYHEDHEPGALEQWLLAVCVLRVFKLERYFHSFRDMHTIVRSKGGILAATLVLSTFLWMLFSTLLYITERSSPDADMVREYGSNMRSPWAEVINLHGEWPWADYTATGKSIATFIALFSIMLFCIPISVFAVGFQVIMGQDRGAGDRDFDRRPWQQRCRPETPGFRQEVYDVVFAHLSPCWEKNCMKFRVIRTVSAVMVAASTLVAILHTLPSEELGDHAHLLWTTGWIVDISAIIFFAFELVCRLIALGPWQLFSVVGFCDIVSFVAQAMTLNPKFRARAFRPNYGSANILDDCIVPLRLLRLVSLEPYLGTLHALKNVLWLNRGPLLRSGFALVCIWFCHATILYLFEHPDRIPAPAPGGSAPAADGEAGGGDGEEDGGMDMSMRYRSVLTALQYSIVHLFGDYPETEYTFPSKVVHFVGIMGGIAVISTFTGVFSACFVGYIKRERAQTLMLLQTNQLMSCTRVARALQKAYRARKARGAPVPPAAAPQGQLSQWRILARNIVYHRTPAGHSIMMVFHATLIVSVVNILASSLPEIDMPKNAWLERASLKLELAVTAVFAVEYVIRLVAAPQPLCTAVFKPWRVFDLVCLFPGIIQVIFEINDTHHAHQSEESFLEAVVMIRAIRILDFPFFHREVVLLGRALKLASYKLAEPAYLSLIVWVWTSSLFMWFENFYKDERFGGESGSMTSVPAAMYWCCIFLTGEWANVDFTYAGSRLCIFYVIFGIAMFSIPVGIIVEAVESTISLVHQEEADMKEICQVQTRREELTAAAAFRRKSLLADVPAKET